MDDCIFCKIIRNEIPAERVFEDSEFIAIRDIQPQAKEHYLVIPNRHFRDLASAQVEDRVMTGLLAAGVQVARVRNLLPQGFRLVVNTGRDGGQTVFHLHLHVLGGEPLQGSFGA